MTSTDNTPSLMLSPQELGRLITYPPLTQQLSATFGNNPTTIAVLRYYCFLTQNIDQLQLDLERHNNERTDLFAHMMTSQGFQNLVRPLVDEFRQRPRRNEPYNRRPTPPRTPSVPFSNDPSQYDAPTPPRDVPLPPADETPPLTTTVPINDNESDLSSYDESLTFHTPPTDPGPLGSQSNPIDVDQFTTPASSSVISDDSSVDGFFHYTDYGVQIVCGRCGRTGHTRRQCIWTNVVTCDRCEQRGHSRKYCTAEITVDRGRMGRQSPPWLHILRPHAWKTEP
jgi:hypothetical protein